MAETTIKGLEARMPSEGRFPVHGRFMAGRWRVPAFAIPRARGPV